MIDRAFGQAGVRVPIVGQGTWHMERDGRARSVDAIRAGLDLGLAHIDTAEMYGSGEVETIVGEAIEGRRDEVFLVSKVLPSNASRTGVIAACERSLKRLRTDHLDGYLLHWPGAEPLSDTVAAFETLKRHGKVLSWGVSNFDEDELDALSEVEDGDRCVCNQVLYHLQQRAIEHSLIDRCARVGMAVVAYSPFGQDRFPAERSAGGRVLAEIGQAHGASGRQVALAFLLRHPNVFAIPKSANVAHVAENAAAGDLVLNESDIAAIDRAFPRGKKPRALPML
jgi:diketogulonate reductase-like aldo/keto reductase